MTHCRAVGCISVLIGLLAASAGAVTMDTVTVGNVGNPADTRYGSYGAVSYEYKIGKYEVTTQQYVDFLNSVAGISDTYGLYNDNMWSNSSGCKIQRTGNAGSYMYSVASDYANRPVNYVSFWDACRFANWLQNGQASGEQVAGTTERGAYTLDGYNGADGRDIHRQADWKWAVTSEDEWYKAAYHKNDGLTTNYFEYPTSSDLSPSRVLETPDSGNNATYSNAGYTLGAPYWRTNVGDHENSDSPYGVFDQGGNVWEWNEAITYSDDSLAYRGRRGGAFNSTSNDLRASRRTIGGAPNDETAYTGFRLSEAFITPEPTSLLTLAIGGLGLVTRRRRS